MPIVTPTGCRDAELGQTLGAASFKAVAANTHPILRGVGPINSRGWYNSGKLADKTVVLQIAESDKKIKAPAT